MAAIKRMKHMSHEGLDGTTVFAMGDQAVAGTPQDVLVVCRPGAVIRPHTHSVDAHMFIVAGSGRVLSDDTEMDGHSVSAGDIVFFEKHRLHGFHASQDGLAFVSRNGGIVDEGGQWDIDFSAHNG